MGGSTVGNSGANPDAFVMFIDLTTSTPVYKVKQMSNYDGKAFNGVMDLKFRPAGPLEFILKWKNLSISDITYGKYTKNTDTWSFVLINKTKVDFTQGVYLSRNNQNLSILISFRESSQYKYKLLVLN